MDKLTDEQIENWRKVLLPQIGPYALIMPREQIQAYRDKLQSVVDKRSEQGSTRVEKPYQHYSDAKVRLK